MKFLSFSKKHKKTVIALIGLFVAYLVYKFISGPKLPVPDKKNYDNSEIPVIRYDSNGAPIYWSPNDIARKIYNDLDGPNIITYPEHALYVLGLEKDQCIFLHNYWQEHYFSKTGKTVREMFEEEFTDWDSKYAEAATYLKSIGL